MPKGLRLGSRGPIHMRVPRKMRKIISRDCICKIYITIYKPGQSNTTKKVDNFLKIKNKIHSHNYKRTISGMNSLIVMLILSCYKSRSMDLQCFINLITQALS